MALISKQPQILNLLRCPSSSNHYPVALSLSFPLRRRFSLASEFSKESNGGGSSIRLYFLRKAVVARRKEIPEVPSEVEELMIEPKRNYVFVEDMTEEYDVGDEESWVDWDLGGQDFRRHCFSFWLRQNDSSSWKV